jgi:UDP-3-O-acyl-N-acetylglucosamine deacetylase
MQQTLERAIEIKGIGLHSGCDSTLIIESAPENYGIQFVRTDINETPIRALYSNVIDVKNCTCIGTSPQNFVSTIEHIMSVLYILGIDNAKISVNNSEVPILDGSGKVFLEKLEKVNLKKQNAPRKYLKVKKDINFSDDKSFIIGIPFIFNFETICLNKDVISLNLLFSKFCFNISSSILSLFLNIFKTISSIGYFVVSIFNPGINEFFIIFFSLIIC